MKAKYLPLLLITILYGCFMKKSPEFPESATSVSGTVLEKHTMTPAAGIQIGMYGVRPLKSFNRPPSEIFFIASALTDAQGHYTLQGSTQEELDSVYVMLSGDIRTRTKVQIGSQNPGLDFFSPQYIVLKVAFQIINNAHPPLRVAGSALSYKEIYARDTTFEMIGSDDINTNICNNYSYFDAGNYRESDTCYTIGSYTDTVRMNFVIDASKF